MSATAGGVDLVADIEALPGLDLSTASLAPDGAACLVVRVSASAHRASVAHVYGIGMESGHGSSPITREVRATMIQVARLQRAGWARFQK
jgi:hypothetical protein